MSSRLRALIHGLWALALAAACNGEQVPPTQVIVTVNSDLEVGRDLTSVEIFVLDPAGERVVAMHPFELTAGDRRGGKVGLPFSLGIQKAKADRFRLDVIGYGPTGTDGESRAVVEHKVNASFRDRETLLLKVFLSAACYERVCTGATTCYPGAEGGVAARACGGVQEPELEPVQPGTESRAWSGAGTGAPRAGAGAGTGIPSGGRGGDAGRGGAPSDAGRAASGGSEASAGAGAGSGAAGTSGSAGAGGDAGGASGAGGAGTGGTTGEGGSGGSAGTAACQPIGEQTHPIVNTEAHVATTMPSDYTSQPPSSGPHCEASGVYATYPTESPLLPCNFVRNLEMGAIVLLYNCPTPCPEIIAALEQVIEDAAADPDCAQVDDMKRLLVTPYSDMDATFAAVSWGISWTSTCATVTASDHAALLSFIEDHWGTRGASDLGNDCSYGTIYPDSDP